MVIENEEKKRMHTAEEENIETWRKLSNDKRRVCRHVTLNILKELQKGDGV